jgi:ATP-dependent DNA helicase RecQ
MENICFSGTKLNISYYIDQIIDKQKQEQIVDYFLNSESDSIEEALADESNADFTEEELRLMRIRFLSEYAN